MKGTMKEIISQMRYFQMIGVKTAGELAHHINSKKGI